MTEYDALVAAICVDPDEDALRLAFADWLEEHDESDRAAFVRAQIELDRTPPWAPFAVAYRWRHFDWHTGQSFRHTLPHVDGKGVEWPPLVFRRGLPWHIHVKSLQAWDEAGPRLLDRAPIGAMHVWGGATLEDWTHFARSPVLGRLRHLHLAASPIEPLRIIREQPAAQGITDLFFHRASGAGMPEVLEDLFASSLGPVLRGLHFHVGHEALDHLVAALDHAGPLERLSFTTMGLTAEHVRRLGDTHALRNLVEFHVRNEHLSDEGVRELCARLPASLCDLTCANVRMTADGVSPLARLYRLTGLRRLDLRDNQLHRRFFQSLRRTHALAGLRSLILIRCVPREDKCLHYLTQAKFWSNLVELDLRGNAISEFTVRALLEAPVPPDLTALVLEGDSIRVDLQNDLRKKYGDRIVLVPKLAEK